MMFSASKPVKGGSYRNKSTFRLLKSYDPNVIHFIETKMLKDATALQLCHLAYIYAINNYEQDMRIIYLDFF